MTSSSQTKSEIGRICTECEIPSDCQLEVLDLKYLGWEENPDILPAGSIVISELHLKNLRLPLHPLYHYIFAIHDIHPLQFTVNSIRIISGYLLLSLIRDLRLGVEDFHHCFNRIRSLNTDRYFFSPKKGWVWFTGLNSKDPEPRRLFLLSGNWQSPVVNREIFKIRRDFNRAKELYHPKTPNLTEERVTYLRSFTVKDKSSGLHISRVVNSTSLAILARCAPFFVKNCVGNPLLFLEDHHKLMSTFPKEAADLSEVCSYSRGLCPMEVSFPGIPEKDEFDKASEIIGKLGFPSSADPVSLSVKTKEGNKSAPSDALVKRKFASKDPPEAQSISSKKKKSEGLEKRTISNYEIPVPGLDLLNKISVTSSEKQKFSEPKKGPSDPLKGPSVAIISSQKPIGTSIVNFKPPTIQPSSSLAPISAPRTLPEDCAFAGPSSVKEKKSFGGTSSSGDMASEDFDRLSRNTDTDIKTFSAGNFKGVTTSDAIKQHVLPSTSIIDECKREAETASIVDECRQQLREAKKKELDQLWTIENLLATNKILEAKLEREKKKVEHRQLSATIVLSDFTSLYERRVSSLEDNLKVADEEKTSLRNKITDLEQRIFSAEEKDREAAAQTKEKCTEVLNQCHARFSRMGVVNSCIGFRLGWKMALLPADERLIADPDSYDLKNKITVNEYKASHYIEHEGLHIEFLKEVEDAEDSSSEREEETTHEAEEAIPQMPEGTTHEAEEAIPQMPEGLSVTADPPTNLPAASVSSGTFENVMKSGNSIEVVPDLARE